MAQKTEHDGQQFRTAALVILGLCGLLALLVYGSGFLIPLVIAGLLTTLISAGITRLQHYGLPNWAAMTVSISAFFLLVYAFGQVFSSQLDVVADALPKYSERFDEILGQLSTVIGEQQVEHMSAFLTDMDFSAQAAALASSVSGLFGSLGLVLMYSVFLLAERGMITKKLGYLFPDPEKEKNVQEVITSVGHGIKRYVWIKTVVSLLTGFFCYLVLRFLGVDFSEILALMIFLLNFIPTVGSILGVVFPALISLLQFETITPFLVVVVLCGGVQFTVGNIIEPKFMGNTLNLSPFTVIVALTFWSSIWGVAGAFMSVPITASLVILFRDIPALRPFAILLSADGDVDKTRHQPGQKKPGPPSAKKRTQQKIENLRDELKQVHDEKSTSKE
ncbi:AI-2E family transporter [Labrenzia sp. VG12]|uniref:AI-2E family transporter n=1 Tax=Labrenzia sp. VG12 TaxID=2021862 RepID=UPI000B8C1BCD|nr:AI-2E family transporter [Labrenzia sp. VG12]ASP35640.1 AI-2E family transporter [Labrenzia sp. VG12]